MNKCVIEEIEKSLELPIGTRFYLQDTLFEVVEAWADYAGYTVEWADKFWQDLLLNKEVYEEFLYYIDHNDFLCKYSFNGQYITDIFIWEMRKFNVRTDRGKNYSDCDKTEMVLNAFRTMLDMKDNAEHI